MPKILYVEDEPFLAKIVKESLESRDFEVIHLLNGSDSKKTFEQEEPEICVLDVMLPGKNGFEIAKEIRAMDRHVPILFLTAKNQTDDILNGFESGGNDYIKKPFSMEELIARIQNLIRLTQGQVPQENLKDQIVINEHCVFMPGKLQLKMAESEVSLSHKEAQILMMLCNAKNSVVDRKEILLEVWGDDSYFNSRTLDVYIRKLRKHLATDESIQIITLKGIGYRFFVGL